MYRVTEVPNSTVSNLAPGWAFVPDTGFDPSRGAIQPSGRKRNATRAFANTAGAAQGRSKAMTARQANMIEKRLAELDKENHRDVHIAIPTRQKDGAGRAAKTGATANTRKILAYQKTFKHWIDDEEAEIEAAQKQGNMGTSTNAQARTARARNAARNNSTPARSTPSAATPAPAAHADKNPKQEDGEEDSVVEGSLETSTAAFDQTKCLLVTEFDSDPLLRSVLPKLPSRKLIDALLAEPPLTWNEARAAPSRSGKPKRHFCVICGYWGKIRCTKCTERVCGLDCYKTHGQSNCAGGMYG